MAFINYVDPADVHDPVLKEEFEKAYKRKGGQEPLALRSRHPWFAHWWYEGWNNFRERSVLEYEILELMRVRCSTSLESMLGLSDCHYWGQIGSARDVRKQGHRFEELDNYMESDQFTHREKLALRYCDIMMTNPRQANQAFWDEFLEEFTEAEAVELSHFIALRIAGQRWIISVQAEHGQLAAFLEQKAKHAEGAGNFLPTFYSHMRQETRPGKNLLQDKIGTFLLL